MEMYFEIPRRLFPVHEVFHLLWGLFGQCRQHAQRLDLGDFCGSAPAQSLNILYAIEGATHSGERQARVRGKTL